MKTSDHVLGLAINGIRYAHSLEEEMAKILESEDIPYDYGVFFKVKNGTDKRQVDFVLKREVRAKLCDGPIKYIELKNKYKDSKDATKQHDDLAAARINTVIFNRKDVEFFKKHGFLEEGDKNGSLNKRNKDMKQKSGLV